jgi:general secretion pathway protein M
MNLTGFLDSSKLSFSEFWAARDARERAMLTAAAAVVIFALVYALLIAPALTGREQMNRNLPQLRLQVAQLQALAKQAETLSGKPATAVATLSRENIEAALARSGLRPQSVISTGDYTKVQLAAVSFASTLTWLEEMQKTALLFVVDAEIVALAQADMVDAILTLRQARNE